MEKLIWLYCGKAQRHEKYITAFDVWNMLNDEFGEYSPEYAPSEEQVNCTIDEFVRKGYITTDDRGYCRVITKSQTKLRQPNSNNSLNLVCDLVITLQ